MNTIWLKIAAGAIAVVIAVILLTKLTSNKSAPAPASGLLAPSEDTDKPKTFYDMAERDKQFAEPPGPVEPQEAESQADVAVEPPGAQEPAPTVVQPAAGIVLPSSITRPTTLYFKPMDEIADIEAQRILPVATAGRSIGRLPVTHYNLMQQGCRQILQRWPDSWYAFRAKQMLEEMPERFWRNYKVTYEELDISKFLKPRPGTQAVTVEPKR